VRYAVAVALESLAGGPGSRVHLLPDLLGGLHRLSGDDDGNPAVVQLRARLALERIQRP
jgi:hypothetical protein